MENQLKNCMNTSQISLWGICRFRDLPPLIPCRGMSRIPENPQSVLVCLFPYYLGEYPKRNVSRYAVPDDYHMVAGSILQETADLLATPFPHHTFVPFVDNSPIPEVAAAELAGLGERGCNGQLIHPDYGSWVFIGTIVTTLDLPHAKPMEPICTQCGACIHACPTGALQRDKPIDKHLCRSFITQKKGSLSPWEEQQVADGGMVWGCDRCLDACPLNRNRPPTAIPAFLQHQTPWLDLKNLDQLHNQKAYNYRPREVLARNCRILYGNQKQE